MLESLDNVSGHPGRSNLKLAGMPRKLTFNLANLSGHPGRNMYPGLDRIAWSGYNPPVRSRYPTNMFLLGEFGDRPPPGAGRPAA